MMLMEIRFDGLPNEYLGCIMSIITPTKIDGLSMGTNNQCLCSFYANNRMIKAERNYDFFLKFIEFACVYKHESVFNVLLLHLFRFVFALDET